jgi:voltage-gated potassium channel
MIFFREVGTAVLMLIVTLWLQCAGLAALIVWVRRSVADDLHRLGPFRSAVLVVQLTAAVVVMHGLSVLLWAGCYRWLCLPSWESAFYFSASSYATVGYGDVVLPSRWRMLGPLESIIGVLMCGISVSVGQTELDAFVRRLRIWRACDGSNFTERQIVTSFGCGVRPRSRTKPDRVAWRSRFGNGSFAILAHSAAAPGDTRGTTVGFP